MDPISHKGFGNSSPTMLGKSIATEAVSGIDMSDSGVNDVGVHNALKFHKTEGDSFAKIKTQAATTNQEPTADQATKAHPAPNTDQTAKAHQEPNVDTASKAHQTAKADIATEADTSKKKTPKI